MSIARPSARFYEGMNGPVALTGVILCAVASCSHPQRPYSFRQDIAVAEATTLIAEDLEADGHPAAVVAPRSGVLVTQWLDTGYRLNEDIKDDFHPPQPLLVEKRIYRRYRVDVVAGHPNEFHVQAEAKRCLPEVVVREQRLLGQCEDVALFSRRCKAISTSSGLDWSG